MRAVRILLVVLVGLALVGWGGWSYLTAREAVPETTRYRIDLEELRRLASSVPGERALRLNAELVAEAALPRAALFAGESLDPHPMSHQVFQIVYADGFLLIDTAFGPEFHATMESELPFDREAWARLQQALGQAEQILITHEHGDHIEGAARYENPEELVGRLRLTREQLENEERLAQVDFPASLRTSLEPLDYDRTLAVAPGVVLQKAPGHTPGSQIIYVKLQDGREFLFLGDVAWHMDQIRNLHYRPRLVTDYFLGEDRTAVLDQFRALHDLMASHPEVGLVVSHDLDQRGELVAAGTMGARLEL